MMSAAQALPLESHSRTQFDKHAPEFCFQQLHHRSPPKLRSHMLFLLNAAIFTHRYALPSLILVHLEGQLPSLAARELRNAALEPTPHSRRAQTVPKP